MTLSTSQRHGLVLVVVAFTIYVCLKTM